MGEEGSLEVDIDGIADNGELIANAVCSHVEKAGTHSGDATLVHPPHNISREVHEQVVEIGRKLAKGLTIHGPFNSQILITPDGKLKVIECNVRASRSLPFVSKAKRTDFMNIATRIMLGQKYEVPVERGYDLPAVGVKCPQFSFARLLGADPQLGVEMASTGEVACFGATVEEAFTKSLLSTHFKLPKKNILLSTGSQATKDAMIPYIRTLVDLGYNLFATKGTAVHLEKHDIPVTRCYFPIQPQHPQARDMLANGDIDLVINVPSKDKVDLKDELVNCYMVRRGTVDYHVPLITDLEVAKMLINSLKDVKKMEVTSYQSMWNI